MNVGIIFFDMLQASSISVYSKNLTSTSVFDHVVRGLGAVHLTSCFTPTPDTPRSLGAFYSGAFAKDNGCNTRTKYPRHYMSDTLDIMNTQYFNTYNKLLFASQERISLGIATTTMCETWLIENKVSNCLEHEIDVNEDNIYFIDFPDFHYAIDDYSGTTSGRDLGLFTVAQFLSRFLKSSIYKNTDILLIFSDHGCTTTSLKDLQCDPLAEHRTKIACSFISPAFRKNMAFNELFSINLLLPSLRRFIESSERNQEELTKILSDLSPSHVSIEDYSYEFGVSEFPNRWAMVTSSREIFYNDFEAIKTESDTSVADILKKETVFYQYSSKKKSIREYNLFKEARSPYTLGSAHRLGKLHRWGLRVYSYLFRRLIRNLT
jgi:hypothetical protein